MVFLFFFIVGVFVVSFAIFFEPSIRNIYSQYLQGRVEFVRAVVDEFLESRHVAVHRLHHAVEDALAGRVGRVHLRHDADERGPSERVSGQGRPGHGAEGRRQLGGQRRRQTAEAHLGERVRRIRSS